LEETFSDLSLNGSNVLINEKQPPGNPQPGNVGIGLMSGNTPEGQVTINGPHSPSSDLLVLSATGTDTNYQWGYNRFGNERWLPYWSCNAKLENDKWFVDIGSFNGSATKIQHGWNNISFQYYKHSSNQQGAPAYVWKELESPGWKTALLMDSNTGNVGIGTTAPRAKLEVAGGVRAKKGDPEAYHYNEADFGFSFEGDGDTGMFASPGIDAGSGSELIFKIDNWKRLQIARNGSVYYWDALTKSDGRLKKNVKPLADSLEKVLKLRGVSYQWDKEKIPETRGLDDKEQIGFIAQEVEEVIPELVSTSSSDGYKAVAYDKMTAVLVEAVKELKAQNDALKTIVCQDHPEEAICQ